MHVAFGAIFRNQMESLDRFITQWYSLQALAEGQHKITPVFVEGDSTDGTRARLDEMFPGHVTTRNHGGPVFGSVDKVERWKQVSYACDGVLERVTPEHDALLWAEADLIWEPRTLLKLLDHLKRVDMVCTMVMMRGHFYDSWAFWSAGSHFGGAPPFHPALARHPNGQLFPLESGGSCWAIRGELARKCRFRPPETAMRGFCREVREAGGRIWLDPTLAVYHPVPGMPRGATPQPWPSVRESGPHANAPGVSVRSKRRVVQVAHP